MKLPRLLFTLFLTVFVLSFFRNAEPVEAKVIDMTTPVETVYEIDVATETSVVEVSMDEEQESIPVDDESAEELTYDTVPLYFQNGYTDVPYGKGTVADSGCGITCVAMVASYLTDTEVLPDELAEKYGACCDSNLTRMEHAYEDLGLELTCKEFTWWNVTEALKEGHVAIILICERSALTDNQHFIVCTGITDTGRILINDPNENTYNNYLISGALDFGVDQADIYSGFQGAWIFEKKDVES